MNAQPAHRARKRFGQNFLHDPGIISRIVAAINPKTGDNLIEIGPGQGALTFPILKKSGSLTAIELDRDLVRILESTAAEHGELCLLSQDALKTDFARFGEKQRIIGNLPYNISSPLLFHLLEYRHLISDMHFMLQKEVVDRMAAVPGNKTYGRLSVMIQTYCNVSKLIDVPPGAFNPPPAVDSAVVRLRPREPDDIPAHTPENLAQIVSMAFAQRRKTLRNNLRAVLNEEQIASTGIKASVRAETLSVIDFCRLSELLEN